MNQKSIIVVCVLLVSMSLLACQKTSKSDVELNYSKAEVVSIINKVNQHWQKTHPEQDRAFWNPAAYHTGNIEAYKITGNQDFLDYSIAWAEKNEYQGAKSNDETEWKYSYGESDEYVLFGDWQICFQTYIDIYNLEGQKNPEKIKRAIQVMEHQMSTSVNDYWWWADGLYMVMPVMTKLYNVTGNNLYLEKLNTYLLYANSIMYDRSAQLYFRDAKYVYPKHKSVNGKKDFWARGNGWVFAGLAKVIQDLPADSNYREDYVKRFQAMAKSLKKSQQPHGYWTRSILDPAHAPGPETSGTAFFTYAYLWGINNGILNDKVYLPVVKKSWEYLSKTALQSNGTVGYVQPIGERAIPGQVVDVNSTADFGVGAFLLAAAELYRYVERKE
ncbi:glycoside hydrolase family 88 protein [Algibacter miyuki]|uniref:Glycoside hydrolase family 88 protein n=1 Tax=Algibacter miyuki TaxID=1306933 RepID=A0ABV5H062_9FLAO|nr:glycoside hydrolase family 88 protein [Algibacter miyuki]MDN3667554.1 glycoside hydrolase family 88 protein [Algibacter miyuki]